MALRDDYRHGVGVHGSRALRLGAALAVLAAGGVLAATALATGRSETNLDALNHQVLAAVNSFRASHNLGPLRESSSLDRSARQHSVEMGKDGYFGHSSANGTAFWQRIQHYYAARKHSYWAVGENILWAAPRIGAGRAMRLWIASPEHLRNILAPRWRELGVSAVHVVRAPGVFHGLPVTIITTDFGVRH